MTRAAPLEELFDYFTDWEGGVLLPPPPDDFWCATYARLEGDRAELPAEATRRRARSGIRRTFKAWQQCEPSRSAYRVVISETLIHGQHKTQALPGVSLVLERCK